MKAVYFRFTEARALVTAALSRYETDGEFGLINTLRDYLSYQRASQGVCIQKARLPQPILVCQQVARMDDLDFLLWRWDILSKEDKYPKKRLLNEMSDCQNTPLLDGATFSQREQYNKILVYVKTK